MAVDTIARAMAARAMDGSGGSSYPGDAGAALMSVNYSTATPIHSLPYTASADCMIIGSVYAPGGGYGLVLNDKIVLAEEGYCNISILVNKGDVLSTNTPLTKIALYAAETITASPGSTGTTVAGMGAPDYDNAELITQLPYVATRNVMAIGHVYSAGGGYSLTINNKIQLAEQGWSNLSFILNEGDILGSNIALDEIAINIVPIILAATEGSESYNPLEDKPSIENVELVGNITLAELGVDLTQYYLKTETYTQQEVNDLIANLTSFNFEIADPALPTEDISETTIYLVPAATAAEDNYYEEWAYISGKWELIGTTKIDLSDYATKEEVQEVQDNLDQEILDRIAADKNLQDQIDTLVEEAPVDEESYIRKNGAWETLEIPESSTQIVYEGDLTQTIIPLEDLIRACGNEVTWDLMDNTCIIALKENNKIVGLGYVISVDKTLNTIEISSNFYADVNEITALENKIDDKQDILVPGDNVEIDDTTNTISVDLSNYYNKTEVDEEIDNALVEYVKVIGYITDPAALPLANNSKGNVYIDEETNIAYIWSIDEEEGAIEDWKQIGNDLAAIEEDLEKLTEEIEELKSIDYAREVVYETDTTFTAEINKDYFFGEVSQIIPTLPTVTEENKSAIIKIGFTSGAVATELVLPDDVVKSSDFTIEANGEYLLELYYKSGLWHITDDIDTKQNKLIAGEGIRIIGNTISSTIGGSTEEYSNAFEIISEPIDIPVGTAQIFTLLEDVNMDYYNTPIISTIEGTGIANANLVYDENGNFYARNLSDNTVVEKALLIAKRNKGITGEEGFSPIITEKVNTDDEYILEIQLDEEGTVITTPNLKGEQGESSKNIAYNLTNQLDGVNTIINIDSSIEENSEIAVFYSGLFLVKDVDYTIDYTNSTLTTALPLDSFEDRNLIIIAGGVASVQVQSADYTRIKLSNICAFNGVDMIFTVDGRIKSNSNIYMNGLLMEIDEDYTLNNNQITFTEAWSSSDRCQVEI